jgi:heme A synthase
MQRNALRRGALAVFFVLVGIFAANVILGKAKVALGWQIPYLLSDAPEFLLLLAAAVFFTVAALIAEREVCDNRNRDAVNDDATGD